MRLALCLAVLSLVAAACASRPRNSTEFEPPAPTPGMRTAGTGDLVSEDALPQRTAPGAPSGAVASTLSRSGRFRLVLTEVSQVRPAGRDYALAVVGRLATNDPDVLLVEVPPLRRFVTTDGTELTYPDQSWSVSVAEREFRTSGAPLGLAHLGLRDLEIDATAVEVLEWEEFESSAFEVGSDGFAALGPLRCGVGVTAEECSVGFSVKNVSADVWRATRGQPLAPVVTPRQIATSWLSALDADGRELDRNVFAEGAGLSVRFTPPGSGALKGPVRLRLRIPGRYVMEATTYAFRDLRFRTAERL